VIPGARFGIAFNEASGPCLIRAEGNDTSLIALAVQNAERLSAGHTFIVLLQDVFPITVLNAIKACPEVCTIHCATGNPVQVIVAESNGGRGILGVIDGSSPAGVEDDAARETRRTFLRTIGYKR
jgi:adenosine/AMP kinase